MSQCVPNWELDDPPSAAAMASINPPSAADVVAATAAATNTGSRAEYEVAELTWVNGHPSMHSLGQLRIGKPVPKYPHPGSWDKALASGGTLESVVDQATGVAAAAGLIPPSPSAGQASPTAADYDLVPWIAASRHHHDHNSHRPHASSSVGGGGSSFMDALVPCANSRLVDEHTTRVPEPHGNHLGPSGSGARHGVKRGGAGAACRDGGGGNCSVSGSAASMGGGVGMSFDACDGTVGGACDGIEFTTSTSPLDGSPETENTSYGRPVTVVDEHDSPSHSRPSLQRDACEGEDKHKGGEMVRSSVSTKRSRAAAVHNQSERKRRDRINQRMKTLQKLVPNSSKTDKASMLDEVIDYVKQLQAQVQMMNRMSTAATIPHMMMPAPMQMQQLQMAAMMAQMAQMAQMGMGMGMAMGMDMAPLAAVRQPAQAPAPAAAAALPPPAPVALHHPSAAAAAAFLPAFAAAAPPSWEAAAGDRVVVPPPPPPVMPTADPFSAFMACQAQKPQMGMDAFNRMAAAMYQQIYHQQQQPQTQPQTQQQNTGANHNK